MFLTKTNLRSNLVASCKQVSCNAFVDGLSASKGFAKGGKILANCRHKGINFEPSLTSHAILSRSHIRQANYWSLDFDYYGGHSKEFSIKASKNRRGHSSVSTASANSSKINGQFPDKKWCREADNQTLQRVGEGPSN